MKSVLWSFVYEKRILSKISFYVYFKCNFKSWSVVFFGSDEFSLCSLTALHKQMKQNLIKNIEVVVLNLKNPVHNYAISNNFRIHIWPPNLNGAYDIGIIVSFGKLIPKNIIHQFPLGIINVHASLLPKYRGALPLVHAVKNGEALTGVTVTRIRHDKFDTGEIILQKSYLIGESELMPSLRNRMAHKGCECLLEVLSSLPESFETSFQQSEKEASYAPKVKKEIAVVKWNEMTALEVYNLYRALFGMFELNSSWLGQKVKFCCLSLPGDNHFTSFLSEKSRELEPGSFFYEKKNKCLYVQCKDKPIAVCSVKFNGKLHVMSSFYGDFMSKTSRSLWKFES